MSRLETRGVWCIAERDGLFQEGCQGYRSRDAAQSGSANSNPWPHRNTGRGQFPLPQGQAAPARFERFSEKTT